MPFALRHRHDPVAAPTPLAGLAVRRETSAIAMAQLQSRSVEEIERRFAAGHRAYVAELNGTAAAWGWVATRAAAIGELDVTFAIAEGDRYLWNFVTLATHRGLGIYPRLLDAIVAAESEEAERFWVGYAPENHASGIGIRKAGFEAVSELSFDSDGRAALKDLRPGGALLAARVLGIQASDVELAQCWRCVRAGKPKDMSCAGEKCRCDYQVPASGCSAPVSAA
jgi:GNAT superfamily N-acetyltransferase